MASHQTAAGAPRDLRELLHQTFEATYLGFVENTYLIDTPGQGSALSGDDKRFDLFAMSQAAQAGIGSAREHLLAAALLWRSSTQGTLMPMAYSSVLRGALLGASTTIWLLSPTTRNDRILRLAEWTQDNFTHRRLAEQSIFERAIREGVTDPDRLEPLLARIELCKHLHAEARQVRLNIQGVGDDASFKQRERALAPTRQFKIVEAALEHAHGANDPMVSIGMGIWGLMSADAHGNVWQKVLRAEATGEFERGIEVDGTLTIEDVNTPETLLTMLGTCTHLLVAAESLYKSRAMGHVGEEAA